MAKGKGELPCPLCGEPLAPGATKCGNCGASIPKQTKDSLATLMKGLGIDAKKAQRLYNLGYRKPDELKGKKLEEVIAEEPRIFLCPECGAFVHEKDEKCSRCGAEFGGEAMEIEDYLVREERACPHCGEQIHMNAQTCPACGKPVAESKGISLGSTYMCPSCGVTVLEGQEACEVCGSPLSTASLIASKALELEAVACPKCGGTLDPDTGICPFCSKAEEPAVDADEGETEVFDEIDEFLEHLATMPETKPKPVAAAKSRAAKKISLSKRVPTTPPVSRTDPETGAHEVESPPSTEGAPGPIPDAEEKLAEDNSLPELMKLLEEESETEKTSEGARAEAEKGDLKEILEFEQPTLAEGEAEAEVEAALGSLDETAKDVPEAREAPKVKLLKPSYSKLVKIHAAPAGPGWPPNMAIAAELMLYATAVGLSLQMFILRQGLSVAGWGFFVFFGMACGLAAGIVAMSVSDLRKTVVHAWQPLIGTIVIVFVPLHWYMGVSLPVAIDIMLAIAGIALWIPSILRTRGKTAWLRLWLGGSLVATVMSPAVALGVGFGGDLSTALMWLISSVLVLAGVALSLETRWLRRSMDVSLQRGEEEFKRKEFKKSIEDYDKAIEIAKRTGDEDLAAPWYSKGAALVVMGRYEEALKAIDEALRINPNNEVAWVNRGNALSRMGDVTGALKAFNAALRANPRYEVAWNNKGNALARMGRYRESIKCYDLALQIDNGYRGAWINKGYVLARIGEYEEAAKCAETVMALGGYASA